MKDTTSFVPVAEFATTAYDPMDLLAPSGYFKTMDAALLGAEKKKPGLVQVQTRSEQVYQNTRSRLTDVRAHRDSD